MLFNNYCIAIFPLLKTINSFAVSDENRRDATIWFDSLCTILNKAPHEISKRLPTQPRTITQDSISGAAVGGSTANAGDVNAESLGISGAPSSVLRSNSTLGISPADNKSANLQSMWSSHSFSSSSVSPWTSKLHGDAVTAAIGNLTLQNNHFNEVFRKHIVALIEDSINEVSRQCPAIVTDLFD